MAKRVGTERSQEWSSAAILRDARPLHLRVAEAISDPRLTAVIAGGIGLLGAAVPALAFPLLLLGGLFFLWWETVGCASRQLPLQIPQQAGLLDRSELNPVTKRYEKGKGILYLGNNRSTKGRSEECWVNNSQSRTHFLMAGTTGSGKTMRLLGLVANALSWASGCIYTDGKADNTLWFNVYSLARRMGRDDHVFVLNFMTGGQDIFLTKKNGERRTNSFNPTSRGSSDDLTQLMTSLMAEAGGDNAMWKGLAVGMLDAVIRGLCYRRVRDGLDIDPAIIRDSIEMTNLIEMVRYFLRQQDVPRDLVLKPLEAYLRNLPGLNWDEHVLGDAPVEAETKKQHDFRSMQFLRQLTMIADTYGKIFRQQIPEVDMLDIVLNNRILVVMIPSMEKSEEEAGAVGKLVVTAFRMMMALNLGDQVEGMYEDAVESKATNAPSPFIVILDELGYYFTKGLAVIFAQARSLGFAMVAAMQDFPALMKGSNKEEAKSVISNTKFKEALAMEDSEETGDFYLKTAGKAMVSEVSGYSGEMGVNSVAYRDMMNASIQERERVTLQELRDLETAQSVMMWRDRIVRMDTFAPFLSGAKPTTKFPVRLNRLVGMHPPAISVDRQDLVGFFEPTNKGVQNEQLLAERVVAGFYVGAVESPVGDVFGMGMKRLSHDFPASDKKTDFPGKDGDIAAFVRLMKDIEALRCDVGNTETTEAFDGDSTSGGGGAKIGGETSNGDGEIAEVIDVSGFIDSLPVEVAPDATVTTDDQEEWISRALMGAAETIVVKPEIKQALEMTDTILTSKQPGDAAEASEILLSGVEFVPAKPLAEPVDQENAKQQVDNIMKALLG